MPRPSPRGARRPAARPARSPPWIAVPASGAPSQSTRPPRPSYLNTPPRRSCSSPVPPSRRRSRRRFPPPPPSVADILASRGQEIAKLNAKIEEDTAAYANRPRRKAISASTQEYKYASYLEAWRRKVESIGNLNYPEEAKRRQLYGNLILRVALRADGTLEEVRVLRSSGSEVLDQAAVRIVNLAAPYAPFPPDIRKETDVLDITRTWQFLSNNRFGEKQ